MSLHMDASFVLKWKCGSEALHQALRWDIVQRNEGTEPAHVAHLYIIFLKYLVSGVGFKPSPEDSHLPSVYSPSNHSTDRTLPNSDHHPATMKVANKSCCLALNNCLFFGRFEFLNCSQHCYITHYVDIDLKLRLALSILMTE